RSYRGRPRYRLRNGVRFFIKLHWRFADRALLMLLVFVGGCTYVNRRLNAPAVPLERRVANHTRAALLADVPPISSTPAVSVRAGTRNSREILDRVDDGCFVGLALSGGGSRSANFAASCMFQLERLGLLDKV